MTLIRMAKRIAELEVQKDLKTHELDKLDAEYDGIKYLRAEEQVEKRKKTASMPVSCGRKSVISTMR